MGFFNKVKQSLSQLVGSTANMQISLDKQQVARGDSVTVTAVLTATGQLKGNSVNIEVTATETVKYQVPVQSTSTSSTTATISPTTTSTTIETTEETKDNQTYTSRRTVDATPFVMNQGETRQYTGVMVIPTGQQPTYKGVDAVHVWKIRAYVDVSMGADIGAEAEVLVI